MGLASELHDAARSLRTTRLDRRHRHHLDLDIGATTVVFTVVATGEAPV